jgi:dihydroflavonol-4-reductase
LQDKSWPVRILARDPKTVRELDVDVVQGDLKDRASLDRAVGGCSVVFHVAADYRLWAKDPNELYRSNVEGTRNLLEASRQAGVERVVYTSTVGCIALPQGPGQVGTEDMPVGLDEMVGDYKRSKFLAEQVALEYAGTGFPVVIVNPTAPIGDHDFRPTPTGRIVVDFLRGNMPGYVDTGLNVVNVRDVAAGHLLALEKGREGERYILGCRNMTLREILENLGRISGRPAPKMQVPYAVAYAAGVVSTAWANLTGREPRAPLEGVKMARKKMFVTHAKAERELGFAPGPPEEALQQAVSWFQSNGYCS